MKCLRCGTENERKMRTCRGCGRGLRSPLRFVIPILLLVVAGIAGNRVWTNMLLASPRSRHSACVSQLMNIQTALLAYRDQNGSLEGVGPGAGEVCPFLYAGANAPGDCAGAFTQKMNQVCESGTFRVDVMEGERFVITARDRSRFACDIYVADDSTAEDVEDKDLRRCRRQYRRTHGMSGYGR